MTDRITQPAGPESEGADVAVVGGGVSGVAAAWSLERLGRRPRLIERSGALGGRSGSLRLGSRDVTLGGKNIGRRYVLFREFAASLGFDSYEHFGINSSRIDDGRLRVIDGSRKVGAARELLRGARLRDAARFARLARTVVRESDNRFLGSDAFAELGRRSDDRPLSAHFGARFCAGSLRPMTVRMNGAEPDEVYLGTFGTNLGMLLDGYEQLDASMSELFGAYERRVGASVDTAVEGLVVRGGRVRGLELRRPDGSVETSEHDDVVLALPAGAAAELIAPHLPPLADELRRVRYFPAAVVLAEYAEPVFGEEVRALIFPPGEPVTNAGAYGMSARHIVRYTFSGRAARELVGAGADLAQLLAIGEERLGRHFPVDPAARRGFVGRGWDAAYCGYLPRHADFMGRVNGLLGRLEGLHLTGDYVRGVSIEACFRAGRECAERVAAGARVAPLPRAAV